MIKAQSRKRPFSRCSHKSKPRVSTWQRRPQVTSSTQRTATAARLDSIERSALKALLTLQDQGRLVPYRDDNTASLTDADHRAAIIVGEAPRHLVLLEEFHGRHSKPGFSLVGPVPTAPRRSDVALSAALVRGDAQRRRPAPTATPGAAGVRAGQNERAPCRTTLLFPRRQGSRRSRALRRRVQYGLHGAAESLYVEGLIEHVHAGP